MNVLIIDIGGTGVKLWHTAHEEHLRFDSGKTLTPDEMIRRTRDLARDWSYEAVALGLPCRVSNGRPIEDPQNLGPGWVAYNFSAAFDLPVRVMNDAALQALGSYDGGRMLFMGLGTAVGSAFIADGLILSLDLGRVLHAKGSLAELFGNKNLEKQGIKKVQDILHEVVPMLKSALMADYVVLGGGSAKNSNPYPTESDAGTIGPSLKVVESCGKNSPIPRKSEEMIG